MFFNGLLHILMVKYIMFFQVDVRDVGQLFEIRRYMLSEMIRIHFKFNINIAISSLFLNNKACRYVLNVFFHLALSYAETDVSAPVHHLLKSVSIILGNSTRLMSELGDP